MRNPHDPKALAAFARWYAFRGVYDWAADFFEQARAVGGVIQSLEIARCHWQLGNRDDAAREFRNAQAHHEAPSRYIERCLSAVQSKTTE